MWLRHALKLLLAISIFSACSPHDRQVVDKLNASSYAYHYQDLDSTEYYARRAFLQSDDYADGKAEALNHLAFVAIIRMEYQKAMQMLDTIPEITDNQVELLISYIQQMRLCQRMSRNRAFYDYREQALRSVMRISEECQLLSPHLQQRLVYAQSELAIVTSTYYYYVGLERQSVEALRNISPDVERDTAQYLNYLYNVGAGGILTGGTSKEICQQEFDYLMRCFLMARQYNYPYFAANAMEALAEHLIDPVHRERLLEDNLPAMKYVNPENISDDLLPLWLADNALTTFREYGDVYQIAGAYRTLASCYHAQGEDESALFNLEQALSDDAIQQAPDLVASIREQLSVAFAAIDDKQQSDYNRNIYLDLQEQTRQDRSLEARAAQLDAAVGQLNMLLWAVALSVVLLVLLLVGFYIRHWQQNKAGRLQEKGEEEEKLEEQMALTRLHIEKGERRALEQRAKVSLVNSIIPFIDRMLHEVQKGHDMEYVKELAEKIEEQNEVLTHWIQLQKGEVSVRIESFPLQPLFDMMVKGKTGFRMKGIELFVEPTNATVKADRVLTLFMLNTLADNARKNTLEGGTVCISAKEHPEYVELSVKDTGVGMSEEQLAHVFERNVIVDKKQSSHGFGLLNCRGIMEKYRKMSQLFSVCMLSAESTPGEGSRFFFRLPKGVVHLVLLLLSFGLQLHASTDMLSAAKAYADSAYFSNIAGAYEHTLCYADSCRRCLNAFYHDLKPESADTLAAFDGASVAVTEIKWLYENVPVNYNILLNMRNESAVAALALHEWELYAYNNRIYTSLFKELSADNSLDDYCRKMQQSQANKTTAIVVLIVLFLIILVAVAMQVVHSLDKAAHRRQRRLLHLEQMEDLLHKFEMEEANLHVSNAVLDNCLSALKHETMYYPSRIRQLVESGDRDALGELVIYYRELYGMLSEQAMSQVDRIKLHLKPLEYGILGDETLVCYLFEILRKQTGQKKLECNYLPKDELYMQCRVPMPTLKLTPTQASQLFVSSNQNIPYLLCRQIVRDHGEATGRRGCGISAEVNNQTTIINITLPRQRYAKL